MHNTPSFLCAFWLFTSPGCASAPPPDPATPADPSMAAAAPGEPAPPAPPPPMPAETAAAPAATAEPAPVSENASAPPSAPAKAKPPAAAGYTGPEPCKLAGTKESDNSPIAQACRTGGVKAAKAKMKELVKRAKDNSNEKFRCDDCHKDPQDNTKLAPDVSERFKKLLAAAK